MMQTRMQNQLVNQLVQANKSPHSREIKTMEKRNLLLRKNFQQHQRMCLKLQVRQK